MAGKFVNEGENDVLDVYLSNDVAQHANLYLRLYTAPTSEPAETAVLTDLTEPVGAGYDAQTIAAADWSVVADLATAAEKTFAATGAWGNVYGYYIATTSDDTGKLLFVEQFSNGPYNIQNNGDEIKVTAKVTAS